jgi:hypothetical protein
MKDQMKSEDFKLKQQELELNSKGLINLLNIGKSTIIRYRSGDNKVPIYIVRLLSLLNKDSKEVVHARNGYAPEVGYNCENYLDYSRTRFEGELTRLGFKLEDLSAISKVVGRSESSVGKYRRSTKTAHRVPYPILMLLENLDSKHPLVIAAKDS